MAGLWDYIRTLFGQKVDEMKDPEVEIEQAIQAAHRRDEALREQAAKVLAHRTRLASEIEDSAEELGKSKELAKQALLKADAAAQQGNVEEAARWNRSAQALAMRMQAAQSNYDLMQKQLLVADDQADQAKSAVMQNAMQLQEVAAKRMEMLGQLETAKMQESVNAAMRSISSSVGADAPSLKEVEDKIESRMAEAQAKAELQSVTPEGSMAELEREVDLAQADTVLSDLRAELGLAPAPGGQLPPGSSSSQLPPASGSS